MSRGNTFGHDGRKGDLFYPLRLAILKFSTDTSEIDLAMNVTMVWMPSCLSPATPTGSPATVTGEEN
jgi:hypothetical protein